MHNKKQHRKQTDYQEPHYITLFANERIEDYVVLSLALMIIILVLLLI